MHVLKDACIYLIAVFAACRLNRLIVRDTITAPLRSWLERGTTLFARFASAATLCRWCTGVYTAAATTAYAHYYAGWSWQLFPLTLLATAWIAPVIAQWLED